MDRNRIVAGLDVHKGTNKNKQFIPQISTTNHLKSEINQAKTDFHLVVMHNGAKARGSGRR